MVWFFYRVKILFVDNKGKCKRYVAFLSFGIEISCVDLEVGPFNIYIGFCMLL